MRKRTLQRILGRDRRKEQLEYVSLAVLSRVCLAPGCSRPVRERMRKGRAWKTTYCAAHAMRLLRYGHLGLPGEEGEIPIRTNGGPVTRNPNKTVYVQKLLDLVDKIPPEKLGRQYETLEQERKALREFVDEVDSVARLNKWNRGSHKVAPRPQE